MPRGKSRPLTALAVQTSLEDDLQHAADLMDAARTEKTRQRYRLAVKRWLEYAKFHGLEDYPISPDALCAFIGNLHRQQYALGTIKLFVSCLSQWHRLRGDIPPALDPKVRVLFRGLARKSKPAKQPKPLTSKLVRQMIASCEDENAVRDAAVMAIGFVTGQRRSELASMRWVDISYEGSAMIVLIPRSKTDQAGEGQIVVVPRGPKDGFCPQRLLRAWKEEQDGRGKGRVFGVSDKTIYRVVKRALDRVGANADDYSTHSLRHGFVMEARRGGAHIDDILSQTRHKSERGLGAYIQRINAANNEAAKIVVARLQEDEEQ